MQKKLLYLSLLLLGHLALGQECPRLTEPLDGSLDVPVDTPITWNEVEGDIGYVISLGTSPGAGDIVNQRSSGNLNYYIPEVGLPENTTIYVTIKLFVFGQGEVVCPGEIIMTEDVTTAPSCTSLDLSYQSTESNATENIVHWNYAPRATGYRLSVGTNQEADNYISNVDAGNVLSYDLMGIVVDDSELFVRVVPYNENGDAANCEAENYSVDVSSQFCEPYFDSTQGGVVTRSPELQIPDVVGICINDLPSMVSGESEADGFRWFKINDDGTETLISEASVAPIAEIGRYRYEGYNTITQAASSVECAASKEFRVVLSEPAHIVEIEVERGADTRTLSAIVEGNGNYEFAIDNANGPYQASHIFRNVEGDRHTLFIKDSNGCGIVSRDAPRDLSTENFPNFFTPNADNANDTWQFKPPKNAKQIDLATIYIFDRYGNLLVEMDPNTKGWDGRFRGKLLPSSTYWYRAISFTGEEIQGYFSLKR
jgi:gliding motility-associated-like protein